MWIFILAPLLITRGQSLKPCNREVALRKLLSGAFVLVLPKESLADVPIDPFNSMCLGFGCNSVQGLDKQTELSKPIEEDSIPWIQFLGLVDKGQVARVEFDDINMSKAWAILKEGGDNPKIIRIGEGYPIELGNSWSSTLFVARILQNAKIDYSFRTALKRK